MQRIFFLLLVSLLAVPLAGQQPAPAATQPVIPSAVLKPGLDQLQQTLLTLRPERWKTSGAVVRQTEANITSISTDMQTTLPPLLEAADHNPASLAQVMPAYRNVSALYDVLIRVTEVSIVAAPSQQSVALQQTLESLETERATLADALQAMALNQAQQLHDLHAQVQTLKNTPPPAPPPCPPPPAPAPPKRRRHHTTKPAPKTTTPPATQQSTQPTTH